MKKILSRVSVAIAVLLVAAFGFLYFTAKKSMAELDGEIRIQGLKDEVIISKDEKGIPLIEATNDEDLYFAQGFIQAQDRLFQMDLSRRQASGRLAEVIGEAAVENDKKFLLFDLRKSAERSIESYKPETIELLETFSKGINTFIKYAKDNGKLPYEFKLLGYEPEDWTIVDSLTIGKYMAYDLGGHYKYQAFNNWVLNELGEDIFAELNEEAIGKDKDIKEIIEINKQYPIKVNEQTASIELPPIHNGSNNWVISGEKSATGMPILADDPHLSLATPSIWYMMHLKSPNQNIAGVIFTGVPGIILGNNEDIAWGVTNYGPDVQDLYIEKRNPDNPSQFELDNEYYDGEIVKHEIKVKGQDPIPFDLEYTKNGIIVDGLVANENPNISISMRWTAHDSSNELEAILDINKASNWDEFEKGLESFKTPPQSFVFADKEGNIGFKSNGNIPIRKKGNAILLVPGYDSSFGWDGYIDFDKLPKDYNPESGFLATANTETGEDLDYHTSNIFAQDYRINRIKEVLSSDEKFDVQSMSDLQMDIKNLAADEFLDKFLNNMDTSIMDEKILESLKAWDHNDDKDGLAPLIFNRWLINTQEYLFKNLMTEDEFKFMSYKDYYAHNLLRKVFSGQDSKLIDKLGGIKHVLEESYKETVDLITADQGSNIEKWNWGNAHELYLKHPLGSANAIFAKLLSSDKIPMSGSRYTVKAAREDEFGYVNHGASWRYIYDVSTGIGEHSILPGQSGHFMSEHYDDQIQTWLNGEYTKIDMNNIDAKHTLKLLPEN